MERSVITCVLVEDEPLAIQMINGYIAKRDDLLLIAEIDNLKDFYSKIGAIPPSIVFLDFRIPGFNGDVNSILQCIPLRSIVVLISASPLSHFLNSAHTEFSDKVYELLKPISFEKFNQCVDHLINERII